MSTARIVSLVVAGVGLLAGLGIGVYARSINPIRIIDGQIMVARAAQQQVDTLGLVAMLIALAGVGGLITFVALSIRDRRQAEPTV